MHAESSTRCSRLLTILIPVLALTGCGEGDGPTSIPNSAADPLNLPPGFCDPINFEVACDPPEIINFNIAGLGTDIQDNPDKSGINVSDKVGRMRKGAEATFGGTRLNPIEVPVDFSAGEVYKIKVWSERTVPVTFKLEETNDGTLGIEKIATHGGGSVWEELCFDFRGQTPANTIGFSIIFDNGVVGGAVPESVDGRWVFYYDDITQVESCVDTGPDTGIIPDVKLYDPAGNPDLVTPSDYAEITPFGSQSVINDMYADDTTYSPVLAVSSGVGYGANVAQVGYTGFAAGFASAYESLIFKVKDMPNNVIFVKLFDGVDSLRINLTSSIYSEELDDGWFQVSIPISAFNGVQLATGIVFESDNTAPMQFTMLLTDIGFAGGGDDGGGTGPTTPDFVLFGTSAPADIPIPEGGPTNFGSGATFDFAFVDTTFDPVIAVTAGTDYGPDTWVAFLAVTGYAAGFADGFDTFNVKVKGSPDGRVEIKLIGAPGEGTDSVVEVNVTTYAGSTDLGDGWYELNIPFTEFTNSANIPLHNGWLVGPPGDQGDAVFVFLMTDVGFSNADGGDAGGGSGITPDLVLFGTTAAADIPIPEGGPTNFGSGATFDFAFADSTFDPVIAVTAGTDYGPDTWVAFLAVTGYAAGFADGYDTFNAKVKGSPDGRVEVKLIGAPGEGTDSVAEVNVTTYAGSTDLGDGWYQLAIPFSEFTNPGNIPLHTGWLLGPPGDQGDAAFDFLMTDVGFSNAGGG